MPLRLERKDERGRWIAQHLDTPLHSSVEGLFRVEDLGSGPHRLTAALPGSPATDFLLAEDSIEGLRILAGAP